MHCDGLGCGCSSSSSRLPLPLPFSPMPFMARFAFSSIGCYVMVVVIAAVLQVAAECPTYRLSGRHEVDHHPLPVVLTHLKRPFSPSPIVPYPIPANETLIGGDCVDGGDQNGPADPVAEFGVISSGYQSYIIASQGLQDGFQTGPSGLYAPEVILLTTDVTELFPTAVRSQGTCNSCWAVSSTEHFQAILVRQGYLSGPYLSLLTPEPSPIYPDQPMYHFISSQQILDCSPLPNTDGCKGGSAVLALRWMLSSAAAGGVVYQESYPPPQSGRYSQPCQPLIPVFLANGSTLSPLQFQPGPHAALNVIVPCFDEVCPGSPEMEDEIFAYMNTTGLPLLAYVDASNWGNATAGDIFTADQCSSSGLSNSKSSHIVQIVGAGYEVATGNRFILVRNTWSVDWMEAGYIRLEYGKNTCGWMNFLLHADLPPVVPPSPSTVDPVIDSGRPKINSSALESTPEQEDASLFIPLPQCENTCIANFLSSYTSVSAQCELPTCYTNAMVSAAAALGSCNQNCACTFAAPTNISADCSQVCVLVSQRCLSSCQEACNGEPVCLAACPSGCFSNNFQGCQAECCSIPYLSLAVEIEPTESESIFENRHPQIAATTTSSSGGKSPFVPLPQCENACIAKYLNCWQVNSQPCNTTGGGTGCYPGALWDCTTALSNCNQYDCSCELSEGKNINADCSQVCSLTALQCTPDCQAGCNGDSDCMAQCADECEETGVQCDGSCCVAPHANPTAMIASAPGDNRVSSQLSRREPSRPLTPAAASVFVPLPQCENTCIGQFLGCWTNEAPQCNNTGQPPSCYSDTYTNCASAMLNCNQNTCGCPLSTPGNINADCSQVCELVSLRCTGACQTACGDDPGCENECTSLCSVTGGSVGANGCDASCCVTPTLDATAVDIERAGNAMEQKLIAQIEQGSIFDDRHQVATAAPGTTVPLVPLPQCENTCIGEFLACWSASSPGCNSTGYPESMCYPTIFSTCVQVMSNCNSQTCACPMSAPGNISADCSQVCALTSLRCTSTCQAACNGQPLCLISCSVMCSATNGCDAGCCADPDPYGLALTQSTDRDEEGRTGSSGNERIEESQLVDKSSFNDLKGESRVGMSEQ